MEFKELTQRLKNNFMEITQDVNYLFTVDCDKEELWNLYLDSFPSGTNNIFRERREYDCNYCKSFIRKLGNVVIIKNGKIKTIWDFNSENDKFQPVLNELNSFILSKMVNSFFITNETKIGTPSNKDGISMDGSISMLEWHHFNVELPRRFVTRCDNDTINSETAELNDTRNVFFRALNEITEDSIQTVLELISQDSLYRAADKEEILRIFLNHKMKFDNLSSSEDSEANSSHELYAWEYAAQSKGVSRIRNTSIGTLLVDISNGMTLDAAVKRYEEKVAPANYMRPKPLVTKTMIINAQKTIVELGYEDSLPRRHARLDDISINDIIFSNRDAMSKMIGGNVFDDMISDTAYSPKHFSSLETISIDNFIKNVLPTTKDVEVFLENSLSPNMVSLIAPVNKDAKRMFKWKSNNFTWAYSGNIADSDIKKNVKNAGGKTDGVLRFSIQWNDTGTYDSNDLDAHCVEPDYYELYVPMYNHSYRSDRPGQSVIYYRNKGIIHPSSGMLDIDVIEPRVNQPAVENIIWTDKNAMRPGVYKLMVHCYSFRGGKGGFRAEIEFDGNLYSFDYDQTMQQDKFVEVAYVTLDKNGNFTIKELLPSSVSSKELWGLKTNNFVPVTVIMNSPNYWDGESNQSGNKHYFFMLKGCINPESPNGFYNEFINSELMNHRRVLEVLGSKMSVENTDDQLSGVGFSVSRRNEVVVRVTGQTKRLLKIQF